MKNKVKFLPWIGTHYAKGVNSKRVMALGESHYCNHPNEAVPELTNSVILDLLNLWPTTARPGSSSRRVHPAGGRCGSLGGVHQGRRPEDGLQRSP